jgi:hypothetical protein
MMATRARLAVVVLVVTISVWSVLDYRNHHLLTTTSVFDALTKGIVIQREVLILGIGIAAWLLLKGRK